MAAITQRIPRGEIKWVSGGKRLCASFQGSTGWVSIYFKPGHRATIYCGYSGKADPFPPHDCSWEEALERISQL